MVNNECEQPHNNQNFVIMIDDEINQSSSKILTEQQQTLLQFSSPLSLPTPAIMHSPIPQRILLRRFPHINGGPVPSCRVYDSIDTESTASYSSENESDENLDWVSYNADETEVFGEHECLPVWRRDDGQCFSSQVYEILSSSFNALKHHRSVIRRNKSVASAIAEATDEELGLIRDVHSAVDRTSPYLFMAISSIVCRPISTVERWWNQMSLLSAVIAQKKKVEKANSIHPMSVVGQAVLADEMKFFLKLFEDRPKSEDPCSNTLLENMREKITHLCRSQFKQQTSAEWQQHLYTLCSNIQSVASAEVLQLDSALERRVVSNGLEHEHVSNSRYNFNDISALKFHSSAQAPDPDAMFGCSCPNGVCLPASCSCMKESTLFYTDQSRLKGLQHSGSIIECGERCSCSSQCRHRVVQNRVIGNFSINIVWLGEGMEWGVRAGVSIACGEFLCQYLGEIISESEASKRSNSEYMWTDQISVVGGGPPAYTIDAFRYGSISRFFNHSCEPNCVAVRVMTRFRDPRVPQIAFFTKRVIEDGEEMTIDYNYKVTSFDPCRCGARKCRQWFR